MNVCVHVFVHVRVHVCTCVCVCMCVNVCAHVCVHNKIALKSVLGPFFDLRCSASKAESMTEEQFNTH